MPKHLAAGITHIVTHVSIRYMDKSPPGQKPPGQKPPGQKPPRT